MPNYRYLKITDDDKNKQKIFVKYLKATINRIIIGGKCLYHLKKQVSKNKQR